MRKFIIAGWIAVLALTAGVFIARFHSKINLADMDHDNVADDDEQTPVPHPVTISSQDLVNQAGDSSALGGYNVLIADRGNNRLIEVNPAKKIIWEYKFDLPQLGLGADDSFFTDGGKSIIVNLEEYHLIEIIDYQTKKVTWSYGVPGYPGSGNGMLNTPDDAYKLSNGDVIVADIKNCRVIEISPTKKIVHQYGAVGHCLNSVGFLNKPNGDTPLPNGHILISNIIGRNLIELDQNWQPIFTMPLPVQYPSDPQQTHAGNILISDYSTPGRIMEVSRQGDIVWDFSGDASAQLNRPSLAIELPNGNILSNDDFNHRVIVIDKTTKQIIWQYGVTGKPGSADGQLSVPDGVDIIPVSPNDPTSLAPGSNIPQPVVGSAPVQQAPASGSGQTSSQVLGIGQVSRHAQNFIGREVSLQGYLISRQNSYDIFSDEQGGTLGYYDLPVSGPGITSVQFGKKYLLNGVFMISSFKAINGYPYQLLLSVPPKQE